MKACWKEDAQAVAGEPQEATDIENVYQNTIFYKPTLQSNLQNIRLKKINRYPVKRS
jgi:hypothetical protein